MTLLGIPVVVYAPEQLLYPAELNYVGTTLDAYFAAIERALRDGWSFERVRATYRWCVLELVRGVADIHDGFDFSEERPRSLLQRGLRAAMTLPTVRERWDLMRRPAHLREQRRLAAAVRDARHTLVESPRAAAAEAAEMTALKAQIGRLSRALHAGTRDAPTMGTLRHHLTAALA